MSAAQDKANRAGQVLSSKSAPHPAPPPPPPPNDWLGAAIERGRREPFAMIADIGPEEATRLLASNPDNRHLALPSLGKIVRDIAGGQWQFNGESIVVAKTGELNDGQHRLAAVENTGKSIRSVIVFGVSRESRETLDTGKARDLADWLRLHGVGNSSNTAATCRLIMAFERSRGKTFGGLHGFSIAELIQRAVSDTALHEASRHGVRLYTQGAKDILAQSTISACLYLLNRAVGPEGVEFVERVALGDNIGRNSAEFLTRRAFFLTTERKRGLLTAMLLRGWAAKRGDPVAIVPEYPIPPLK